MIIMISSKLPVLTPTYNIKNAVLIYSIAVTN